MGIGASKKNVTEIEQYEMEKRKKNCICKIKINNCNQGYGFLCLDPNSNTKMLLTDTSTLDEKTMINKNKTLELIFNDNNSTSKKLTYLNYRAYYKDEKNNIMVVEIIEEDSIGNDYFLELDSFGGELKEYKEKDIYFLPYKVRNNIFPTGKIKCIENDFKLKHDNFDFDKEPFRYPILLFENNKVIGYNENKEYGIFLKSVIEKFKKKLNENDVKIKKENFKKKMEEEKKRKMEEEKKRKIEEEKKRKVEEEKKRKIEEEKKSKKKKESSILNNGEKLSEAIKEKINNNKRDIAGSASSKVYKTPEITNNIRNNINIKLNIESNDLNKEIYFLGKFDNKREEKGFSKFFEDNKNKINIFINGKEANNLPNFKPSEVGIYEINIEIKAKITDCGYMFYECSNIIEIDMKDTDLSEVEKMNDMFNYCINLKKVKLPDNIKKVTDMRYMFNYCKNLEKFEGEKFDTENVTNMSGMFQHCEKIKSIKLDNFDTRKVVQMGCMFNNCYELEKLTLKFNTNEVKFMPWLFYGCEKLKELDISSFNFRKNQDVSYIFEGCDELEKVIVSGEYYYQIFKNTYKNIKFKRD